MKKPWIGKVLTGIGIIHSIFGLIAFRNILGQLFREGLFNTVTTQFDRNAAFWFLFAGFILILLGIFMDDAEKKQHPIPRALGWGLLMITLPSVVILPASGLWLLFIPAIGIIKKKQ
ncbi:DUF6463 family protein [Chitinophaga sp. HK235]|uniref:DUF6463 family protein n=1 Tax=Chitinophaga sp. HK235 TaxID=2952571 RepID=UPI001BAC4685|nr:DUF6463 family protein [Chitinophaga sp. HK235]